MSEYYALTIIGTLIIIVIAQLIQAFALFTLSLNIGSVSTGSIYSVLCDIWRVLERIDERLKH